MSLPPTRSHKRPRQEAPDANQQTSMARFLLRVAKEVLGDIESEHDVGSVLQYISAAEGRLFDGNRPVRRHI